MKKLELLPAVDVKDGRAVRLVQGALDKESIYGAPLEVALEFQAAGAEWLHLVDLDAAFGRGSNATLLAEVVAALDIKVELSGGIRDDESLKRALATGCTRINLGTAALENPDWTAKVIGDDPRPYYKKYHKNLEYTGWITHKQTLNIFSKAAIVTIPSLWEEPLGRTSIEASSRGCATILSKSGGLVETNNNGIFLKNN